MEKIIYYVGMFLLAISIHYLIYIASISNVTYLEYKYRYKKMFMDWLFLFFVFIVLPIIINFCKYE
mgnify:CR=1 FL=1